MKKNAPVLRASVVPSMAKTSCKAKVMAVGLESIIHCWEEAANNLCIHTIQSTVPLLPNLDDRSRLHRLLLLWPMELETSKFYHSQKHVLF